MRLTFTHVLVADRKGFTKLALETGCSVVPCFAFGEKWVHSVSHPPSWLSALLYKRFRVSGSLLRGRGPTFLGKPVTSNTTNHVAPSNPFLRNQTLSAFAFVNC